MKLQKIDTSVYIASQISIMDLAELAQTGIRTIICNRPDGEDIHQTDFSQLEKEAKHYNICMHYVPVSPAGITKENFDDMLLILGQAEYPLLAYCRSGTRSARLYQECHNEMK